MEYDLGLPAGDELADLGGADVDAVERELDLEAILVTRFAPKRELYWFPFTKRNAKLLERVLVLLYGRKKA